MSSTEAGPGAGHSLLLVDGSALLYRSHFAFLRKPLRNAQGEVTSAVFGVLQAVLPLLDKRKPDRVAMVFDTVAPTFRHRVYAEYKAHRPPMPDDLACQIPRVRDSIRYLGIPIVEQEGVEADDLIGSLACEAARDGATTLILTSDKDFYQLVNDRILLLSPKGRGGELLTIDREGVGRLVEMAVVAGRAVNSRLETGVCGEHGGDPDSIHFFHLAGLDYVSCSPFRVPAARLEAGRAALTDTETSDSR